MCDGKRAWRPAEGSLEEIQKHDLEVIKEIGESFKAELQFGNDELHRMVRRVGSGR
jgi:hypothetical protein